MFVENVEIAHQVIIRHTHRIGHDTFGHLRRRARLVHNGHHHDIQAVQDAVAKALEDRNFLALRGVSAEEAMNKSINEMLARTLITGITTLLVLVALLMLGGESIAPFSIALIVGIIVGTYSSIYTASATALLLGVNAQDLIEPIKDPELIDDLP